MDIGKNTLLRAAVISVNLNAVMILLGMVATCVKPLSGLAKVSQVIAIPPSFLLRLVIHPSAHASAMTVVLAMLEGLIGSMIFYTVVAWIVLQLIALRQAKGAASRA